MSELYKESDRWPLDRAKEWYEAQPWLCGFNYLPNTAVNSTEMLQSETFDPERIDASFVSLADKKFERLSKDKIKTYLKK